MRKRIEPVGIPAPLGRGGCQGGFLQSALLSVHKESYLPQPLPGDLRVANKPGQLEGVRNDSGIVFTGNRPYVITIWPHRLGPRFQSTVARCAGGGIWHGRANRK
jgi:hypothetical protein